MILVQIFAHNIDVIIFILFAYFDYVLLNRTHKRISIQIFYENILIELYM